MFIDFTTDYSLLSSLIKVEDLIKHAKESGWRWVGTADNSSGGFLDFFLAAKEAGVKPVLGIKIYICNALERTTTDQIILYPKNLKGYKCLLKIVSQANIYGFRDGRSNLPVDWMDGNVEDMMCVLPIGQSPIESKTDDGNTIYLKLKELFRSRLYLGMYDRDTGIDSFWLEKARAKNVKYLPLGGVRYFKSDDFSAYKTLRAIKEKNTVEKMFDKPYLDESLEAAQKRTIVESVLKTLDEFVAQIDLDIPTPGLKVPKFPIPEGFESSQDYLVHLCREGFNKKKNEFNSETFKLVSARMKLELDTMKKCQLADYFLLVFDICQYCDEHQIPRGLARGSCAGSLVCFLLDISRVNPLDYDLLFERFLNEDRTRPVEFEGEIYLTDSADIDLDVSQIRRQEVINYLKEKYGNVSKISTHTTLTAKACLKDTIRAHGKSEWEATYVASFVDIIFGKSKGIEETYKEKEKFREWADKNKNLYDIALKLEDITKNQSIHAAGALVDNNPIETRAPLMLSNHSGEEFKQDVCVAFSLDYAAKAGLLKLDLLGLRTTDVLDSAIKLIESRQINKQ